MEPTFLESIRHQVGMTQAELAARAGTSRPTLSAYERGRKSPTLTTVERILDAAGYSLSTEPKINFTQVVAPGGGLHWVPDRLWRLPIVDAFANVRLPLELNWSTPGTTFHLGDRRERARCYEVVLREGTPAHIRRYVDGALLTDLWPELVLPRELRSSWQDVIANTARSAEAPGGRSTGRHRGTCPPRDMRP